MNRNDKKIMQKSCVICSANIEVTLNPDRTYENGNYFGRDEGREYWECEKCYVG